MGTVVSAEEAKQEYQRAMGQETGERFYDLWQDVSALHVYWAEYVVLFGTHEKRVDLLNRVASGFAWMLDTMMWERTMIHITRLLDSPKDGKQQRASLRALPRLVDAGIKDALEGQLNVVSSRAGFCWRWRDGYIAHRDLDLALNKGAKAGALAEAKQHRAVAAEPSPLQILGHAPDRRQGGRQCRLVGRDRGEEALRPPRVPRGLRCQAGDVGQRQVLGESQHIPRAAAAAV